MRRTIIRITTTFILILVAGLSGYLVSSNVGQEAVRREAESQLTRLLRGRVTIGRADLRIRSGLWVEGRDIQVYPTTTEPGLMSRRVAVRIDVLALLTGRFRLRHLILDGIHMEIERDEADRWNPYPINAIDTRRHGKVRDDLEGSLGLVHVFEVVTRVLLERPFIAQQIDVLDGSVRLTDKFVRSRGKAPMQIEINSIHGSLVHDWLRNSAEIGLYGTLSDEQERRVPIEVVGNRRPDGGMRLDVAITKFPLEDIRDYFQDLDPSGVSSKPVRPMAGSLSGVFSFDTPENDHGVLEIDWSIGQLDAAIMRGSEMLHLESERASLGLRLELHPGRMRIETATFRGSRLQIEISGAIERPLRESSPANFAVFFHDVGLDDLRRAAGALPHRDNATFLRVLDRIEEGKISRIGGTGSARFAVWQAVFRGERMNLPPSFETSADVSNVTIDTGGRDKLEKLSGRAAWLGDRFEIRDARGTWNGEVTPTLNLVIEGFPEFVEAVARGHDPFPATDALPGLGRIEEIFGSNENPDDENSTYTLPAIEVEVDHLEHPALIWPIRDALIRIETEGPSTAFRIYRGSWAGARINGDIIWMPLPDFRVDAHLRTHSATASIERNETSEARFTAGGSESPADLPGRPPAPILETDLDLDRPWAKGRFFIDGNEQRAWLLGPTVAAFEFSGSSLAIASLHGALEPRGNLDSAMRIEFSESTHLPIEIRFQITEGHAQSLTSFIGFPDNFASGRLDLSGHLFGDLYPDQELFADIVGDLDLVAKNGEIRQSIPLISALAHATEGFNPLRARDAIVFESIEGKFHLDRGRVTTREFRLDGPLRFNASGRFDFARPEREIQAEFGIFIFRQVDKLLGDLPLIGNLIPGGRNRGLFGAYFDVEGSLDDPKFIHRPLRTLTEGTPLPGILKAPIDAIRDAMRGGKEEEEEEEEESIKDPADGSSEAREADVPQAAEEDAKEGSDEVAEETEKQATDVNDVE